MTGDVTINPTASCLVMTTEVSEIIAVPRLCLNIIHRFCDPCFTEDQRSCERSPGLSSMRSITCETRVSCASRQSLTRADMHPQQNVVSFGKKLLFSFLTPSDTFSSLPPSRTVCNSPNGSVNYTTSLVTSSTPTSDQHRCNTTCSQKEVTECTWLSTRRVFSEKTTFRRRWVHLRIRVKILPIPVVEEDVMVTREKVAL